MPYTRAERLDVLSNRLYTLQLFSNDTKLWYANFCNALPGDTNTAGTANETTVFANTRFYLGGAAWYWDAATSSMIAPAVLGLTGATGSDTITHWIVDDSSTYGSGHKWYEEFPYPINVGTGDNLRFQPDKLRFTFTDVIADDGAQDYLTWATDSGGTAINGLGSVYNTYWALSSTAPNKDGTNFTEPVGGGYARSTSATSGLNGSRFVGDTAQRYNSGNISFPTATAPWPGLTHWGCFSATSGGTFLLYGELDSTVTVLTGETPRFLADNLRVSAPPL